MTKKIGKNIICKCKKFSGYTIGYICRICKLPIYAKGKEPSLPQEEKRECKCIKCVGNCNHFGCKFHTRTSPQRKSVPVPEKIERFDESRLVDRMTHDGLRDLTETEVLIINKLNEIISYLESWRKG